MKKLNKTALLFIILVKFSFNLSAQTNNPGLYCFPVFSISPCNQPGISNLPTNTVNDFIDSFLTSGAITNITNLSSGCNGLANNYIYYCEHYLVAHQGAVITCSVQSGINFDQSFALFVDWDQNGNFDLPAERLDASTVAPTAFTWFNMTFTVPLTQANGTYRMRLRCYNTPSNTLVDPCNFELVGETEDYNLFVGNSAPSPLFAQINVTSPICIGQNINIQLNHNGSAPTFYWTGPGGFSSYQQNLSFTNANATMAGVYTLVLSDGPCSVTKTVAVNIIPIPTITVNNATVCAGSEATIVATGATNYAWNIGQTSPTVYITPPSTSTIFVTGTTNGCSSASQNAIINVVNPITLSISSTNTLICAGTEVTLSVSGADTYTWSTGFTGNKLVFSPTVSAIFTITGTYGPCEAEIAYSQIVEDCSALSENNSNINAIQVFPNPFTNELKVGTSRPSVITLYNSTGQILQSMQSDTALTINTAELKSGIYFIGIRHNAEQRMLKIFKN